MTSTISWAEAELSAAALGDARLTRRAVVIAQAFAAHPEASVLGATRAAGAGAAAKAAYRFFDNDRVEGAALIGSHRHASGFRAAGERVVLAVQDTTPLDYSAHEGTQGLGILTDPYHFGLWVHTTLLVTPHKVPLGVIGQQVWVRPAEETGKKHTRKQRPVDQKESRKWLAALKETARFARALPRTRVVMVGDREADLYDLFRRAERFRQPVLIRAAQDRRVEGPERRLWPHLEAQPVAGTRTIETPRRPSQPSRKAVLSVRFAPVCLRPPGERKGKFWPTLSVWGVLAREEAPPEGVKPVEWLLLTSVPVENAADAEERIEWYCCRWVIEEYHRVLESGCRVEARQLQTAERLRRCLALDAIVAWQILYLTRHGRAHPQEPCTSVLSPDEWPVLYAAAHPRRPVPEVPPTLREVTHWIAGLGGFLGRKGDGEPGALTLWRGWRRLQDFLLAWQLFQEHTSHPPPDDGCG